MASEDIFDRQDTEEFNINTHLVDSDKEEDLCNLDDAVIENDGHVDEVIEELENDENTNAVEKTTTSINKPRTQEPKLVQLPLSKIRALMKLDPDMHLASTEAVFSVTKATELFIENLAKESYSFTAQSKKKTVQKRDVELAIAAIDSLMFLEGSMNF